MKKKLILIILTWFSLVKVSQAFNEALSTEEIMAMSNTLQTYAMASAVLIAIAAIIVVFRNAKKMKGGVFGTVLSHFGLGMIAILLGFIADSKISFLSVDYSGTVSNIFFILGYILMAMAAVKMSKAICN